MNKIINKNIFLLVAFAGMFFMGMGKISNAATIPGDVLCNNAAHCTANCASGLYKYETNCGESGACDPYYTCIGKKSHGETCTADKNCVSGKCISGKCGSGSGGTELPAGISCNNAADCAARCASGLSKHTFEGAEAGVNVEVWTCADQKDNSGACTQDKNCRSTHCVSGKCATVVDPNPETPGNETGVGGSTSFINPLQYTTVESLLDSVLSAIQKIVVVLALVFIAIGAVMILVSAGSPETVEKGKKTITMAIVGLAIGIAAPSILKELGVILNWNSGAVSVPGSVSSALSLSQIALNVLHFLLGIIGVLALIMLVIGGIMYLTSAGDEERVESGKKIFKYSLIGIVVVMASMVIVKQITYFFIAG